MLILFITKYFFELNELICAIWRRSYIVQKILSCRGVKHRVVERRDHRLIMIEVFCSCQHNLYGWRFNLVGGTEYIEHLLILLARLGRFVLGVFLHFLFQAAFTITMHLWFIAVFTKVFGNKILIGKKRGHDYHLAECLHQNGNKKYYGNGSFQNSALFQCTKVRDLTIGMCDDFG